MAAREDKTKGKNAGEFGTDAKDSGQDPRVEKAGGEEEKTRVEVMVRSGAKPKAIARVIGISIEELKEKYSDEIATATTKADAAVMQIIYEKATGEQSLPAAMFWAKMLIVPKMKKGDGSAKSDRVPELRFNQEAPNDK